MIVPLIIHVTVQHIKAPRTLKSAYMCAGSDPFKLQIACKYPVIAFRIM